MAWRSLHYAPTVFFHFGNVSLKKIPKTKGGIYIKWLHRTDVISWWWLTFWWFTTVFRFGKIFLSFLAVELSLSFFLVEGVLSQRYGSHKWVVHHRHVDSRRQCHNQWTARCNTYRVGRGPRADREINGVIMKGRRAPYKWPRKKWVTGLVTKVNGVITLLGGSSQLVSG